MVDQGGVGGLAADLGDEGGDILLCEQHGVGGTKIMGDDDGSGLEGAKLGDIGRFPREVADDAISDKVDVATPLSQVRVFHFFEESPKTGDDPADSPLGVDVLA